MRTSLASSPLTIKVKGWAYRQGVLEPPTGPDGGVTGEPEQPRDSTVLFAFTVVPHRTRI